MTEAQEESAAAAKEQQSEAAAARKEARQALQRERDRQVALLISGYGAPPTVRAPCSSSSIKERRLYFPLN